MSFNLRRHKLSDGENAWHARRQAAADVIRGACPDILGTQEGLEFQVEDLLRALPEYAMLGEARMGGRLDEFNAIFYRREHYEVRAHGNFWLSDTPDEPGSRTWGNYVPRMATWAEFSHRESGEDVLVVNTHFDHFVPGARRKAAELVHSRIPEDADRVIVMGDLNSVPHGGTYRYLTGSRNANLCDSLRVAEERPPSRWNATFHNWTGRGLYRIDYILTRGPLRVLNHRVVRDAPGGRYPSDHFPVYADIAVGA